MTEICAVKESKPRRAALRRRDVLRPPWTSENQVRQHCTSCGDCIAACPESILVVGPAGTPAVDFSQNACTFCGACAEACKEDVFGAIHELPWALVARIGADCFLKRGIACRSCTDVCDERAIRFDVRGGLVGAVNVRDADCTGCGACVGTCPADAITLFDNSTQEAAI